MFTPYHILPPSGSLCLRFELRHADNDILQMLESTVPPADVEKVGIFLQPLKRYQVEVGDRKTMRMVL